VQHRPRLPALHLGQVAPSSTSHSEPAQDLSYQPASLRPGPSEWYFRFQLNTTSTSRYSRPRPRKTFHLGTWAPHAKSCFYLGPALTQYRYFRVWVSETAAERDNDTLTWFPRKVVMPTASSTDATIAAASDLTRALRHPSPASALSPLNDNQHAALQNLADIFMQESRHPFRMEPTRILTKLAIP
jgi:hypothetical protein